MDITIRYFGAAAEVTGKKTEQLHLENNTIPISMVQAKLEEYYPGLKNLSYTIALNQSIANQETLVSDLDELAILPPFAGG